MRSASTDWRRISPRWSTAPRPRARRSTDRRGSRCSPGRPPPRSHAAFGEGALIATAPAGSPAGSRDASTLAALRGALESGAIAEQMNGILFDVSSRVPATRSPPTRSTAIAASARISLEQQAGVDLDTEAANLVRYQQAFQASGRAMQVAADIFDTLLAIG